MFKKILDLKVQYQDKYILAANYLFIVYAFFLPIYAKPVKTIFGMVLVLFLLSGNIKEKLLFAFKDKVVQAFLLFVLVHLIWILGSENLEMAVFKLKELKYVLYMIVFIAVIRKDFIYKILTGFLLGIFFSEIVSYLMLFDIRIPYLVYTGYGVNVPFMETFTQYSTVLSISLGILLYGIVTKKQKLWVKIIYVMFFISASSNIFIIQSKLGYGLYAISILTVTAMIMIKYKKYFMLPVSLVLIFGGYFIAYNTSDIFHNRVNDFFNQTEAAIDKQNYYTSTGARVGFYVYSYEIMKENFLFGVGAGDHIGEFKNYVKEHETNKKNIHSMYENTKNGEYASLHSEFLDNTLQFGIIGLLVFLNIFYQLLRYPYDDHYMKVVQIIFIVILLSVSSVSLVFLYAKLKNIFIFLSALTLMHYHNEKRLKLL
ncbi:O-antigen ligase family protein [Sulfurimonas lithotrophica]|uniref:O-antigen ligase family protein n=1 Tax=Sulfurimonas lithotrophica TaxID=2590022 RepID=A0A5P8NYZ0_9BACT|nr:O-antigen ligase family protein [Sulfurimonas lithotrophica]QFR48663.1 O-antigen ligase family protein [Sulfurimonas lithotrophica]